MEKKEYLKKAKIINGTMILRSENMKTLINPVFDKKGNILRVIFEQVEGEKKARIIFEDDFDLIPEVIEKLKKYQIEEERREFVKDCLLRNDLINKTPIIEVEANVENSIVRKLASEGVTDNVVLVNSHISYPDCEKIGFTNVLAGEVLTATSQIWTTDFNLRDRDNIEHPRQKWAEETKRDLFFTDSTLLCLSRRKDIHKLVAQFDRAFVGYYGIAGSKQIKWAEAFYRKELDDRLDDFTVYEETKNLSDDSKALVRLFMKK